MPIRPDLRKYYGYEWKHLIRPQILARARNRCERCGVPNHTKIFRGPEGMWRLTDDGKPWHRNNGNLTTFEPVWSLVGPAVKTVLTVAHLNHIPGDDRDENLAALCQWCHLHHDRQQNQQRRQETRVARKDEARPLLAAGGA